MYNVCIYAMNCRSTVSPCWLIYLFIYVARSGKRYISAQKLKMDLLASKESAKLAFSNDAIVVLVAASLFTP